MIIKTVNKKSFSTINLIQEPLSNRYGIKYCYNTKKPHLFSYVPYKWVSSYVFIKYPV